ncbi:MAG: BrnA antitoxin family protein [Terracidiphilus sp.]|jgi:uncharacterized protein (DUF4415 family)
MESTDTVYFHLDPSNPPTMTEAELKALRELRDEDIDFSDIPLQTGGGWRRVSELVPAENKQQITLRLDADLIAFFRATGRRYQSRINAALREYVTAQKK